MLLFWSLAVGFRGRFLHLEPFDGDERPFRCSWGPGGGQKTSSSTDDHRVDPLTCKLCQRRGILTVAAWLLWKSSNKPLNWHTSKVFRRYQHKYTSRRDGRCTFRPGWDGETLDAFAAHLSNNLRTLGEQLRCGDYRLQKRIRRITNRRRWRHLTPASIWTESGRDALRRLIRQINRTIVYGPNSNWARPFARVTGDTQFRELDRWIADRARACVTGHWSHAFIDGRDRYGRKVCGTAKTAPLCPSLNLFPEMNRHLRLRARCETSFMCSPRPGSRWLKRPRARAGPRR